MNWFQWLFSNSGFMPRAICGVWTPGMIFLHNASDFLIWTAYIAIPLVLIKFASVKRRELPFRRLFWLFGVFILACGTTHFMDIVMFYNPLYRLAGVIKLITAAASWGTVIALYHVTPLALRMRSPEELEREIEQRKRAEQELQQAHDNLEARIQERTSELLRINSALNTSDEQFRTMANSIPQLAWKAGPDSFIFWYNRRWAASARSDYTSCPGECALKFSIPLPNPTSSRTKPAQTGSAAISAIRNNAIVSSSSSSVAPWNGRASTSFLMRLRSHSLLWRTFTSSSKTPVQKLFTRRTIRENVSAP